MHLQGINPSADPVLVKETYEPHELYVCSSGTYKRVIKTERRRRGKKLTLRFGKYSSYVNLLEIKHGHKDSKEGINSNACCTFRSGE